MHFDLVSFTWLLPQSAEWEAEGVEVGGLYQGSLEARGGSSYLEGGGRILKMGGVFVLTEH